MTIIIRRDIWFTARTQEGMKMSQEMRKNTTRVVLKVETLGQSQGIISFTSTALGEIGSHTSLLSGPLSVYSLSVSLFLFEPSYSFFFSLPPLLSLPLSLTPSLPLSFTPFLPTFLLLLPTPTLPPSSPPFPAQRSNPSTAHDESDPL